MGARSSAGSPPKSARSNRSVVAGALLLIALAVTGVILTSFNFIPVKDTAATASDGLDDSVKEYHQNHADTFPFTTIVMAIRGVNSADRTLLATVELDFLDQDQYPEFVDAATGKTVSLDDDRLIGKPFALRLTTYSGEVVVNFAAKDIAQSSIQRATLALPVEGSPQSFPNDSYNIAVSATIATPRGILLRIRYNAKSVTTFRMPVAFAVANDDRIVDWRISAESVISTAAYSPNFIHATVRSTMRRPLGFLLFTYSIALAPALLGIAFLVRIRNSSGQWRSETSSLELGAALIALLTLRQVLVPTDIPGITRLDKFLGLEIVALVTITAIMATRIRQSDVSDAGIVIPESTGVAEQRHSALSRLLVIVLVIARGIIRGRPKH